MEFGDSLKSQDSGLVILATNRLASVDAQIRQASEDFIRNCQSVGDIWGATPGL